MPQVHLVMRYAQGAVDEINRRLEKAGISSCEWHVLERDGDEGVGPWLEYCCALDWGPGRRDESAWNAFLRAANLNVAGKTALHWVCERIRTNGGTLNPGKLNSQLHRAYEYVKAKVGEVNALVKPPKPEFSPEKLAEIAAKIEPVDEQWLAARSPIDPQTVTSRMFLEHLYQPAEKVLVFDVFESQGQCLYTVGERWSPPLPNGGVNGIWFLANPVDGEEHPNPRQDNKPSRRSEESINSWRYMVIESDEADVNHWLAFLAQSPLRIAAIYTSGGKSIHALVRLDAESKADWDAQRDQMKQVLVTMGADEQALTAVRLSRLPGTWRGNRMQKLLYLNPDPDGTPIVRQPIRLDQTTNVEPPQP